MENEFEVAEELELTPAEEIIGIIESELSDDEIREQLDNYHENDIADALAELTPIARRRLYKILGTEKVSEIFTYIDDVAEYLDEISMEQAADVLENMDADDAVDALEDIEDEEKREKLLELMDDEASEDVRLIASYEDDEVGSMMTTNYVTIPFNFTVKEAMKSLVSQAEENDNINTIYVLDGEQKYYGAIDLRDLIVARQYTPLEDIIAKEYPSINDTDKISDVIEKLKDYAEDSIPVLNEVEEIIGVITSEDIIEAVDDEMGDDYAKLAGLAAEEDLNEKLLDSIKKRLPWLILLLGLAMIVSTVASTFEAIMAQIAIIVSFQSMILGMAGNVGTQSLAVTIRVLMDENISGKDKFKFAVKEMRIGGTNGFVLGSLAFVFVGLYMHAFKAAAWSYAFSISGCVGISIFVAMIISSLVGALVPMFFHKIKVDPAVASGPLISTINDLVAVVTYYSLAGFILIGILGY